MDIAIDPDRLAAVVEDALEVQTPRVRAYLVDLMATDVVDVFTGEDGRAEYWTVVIGDLAFCRVHRSRVEVAPILYDGD